ncbi:MAG: hypothetical protein LJE70_09620 [Chromatiaceae bacterium]|nr:hypothetical protein [Chromatiaceae bacterium]
MTLLVDGRSAKDRVLITARPYAYAQLRWQLPGIPALVLAPFDANQRAAFWQRWYRAARPDLNLTADAADTETKRLTNLVEEIAHVRDLAERPLLATMLVLVYQRGNRLPPGRVELYGESLDLLELGLDFRATEYREDRDAIRRALIELIEDSDTLDPAERAGSWAGSAIPAPASV